MSYTSHISLSWKMQFLRWLPHSSGFTYEDPIHVHLTMRSHVPQAYYNWQQLFWRLSYSLLKHDSNPLLHISRDMPIILCFFFVPYHGSYLLLFLRKIMFLPMHSYAWDDIFLLTFHGYPLGSSILMYSLIVKILTLISPSISLEVMTLSVSSVPL